MEFIASIKAILPWFIRAGNYLRLKYYYRADWEVFRPWREHFKVELRVDSKRGLITHATPFVGFDDQLTSCMEHLIQGEPVVLVSAAPGCGKSRFALELARKLGKHESLWECFFVGHDLARATASIRKLRKVRRIVLFIDDAHKCPDLADRLAKVARESEGRHSLHVVCLCRLSLLHVLTSRIKGGISRVELGNLGVDQLSEIIQAKKRRLSTS